jgi:uncharacterized membrane protein
MNQTPNEVRTANLVYLVFWVLVVLFILIFGKRWHQVSNFREKMLAQWKPSLAIAALFILSMGIAGRGFFNLHGVTLFCQSLIGFALAQEITDFEPLPVTQAVIERKRIGVNLALMIGIATIIVLPALIIGTVGLDIGQHIFGETDYTSQATSSFPPGIWTAFFMLLGGAGLAEETPFRLVFLSLFWRFTQKRKLSILLSALIFGAYHLSPLNGMYQIFLQYPISQFLASTLIGLVWGYLYVKRGYETTVLAHTFSDWLPLVIFGAA